jgi:hypothetical protein
MKPTANRTTSVFARPAFSPMTVYPALPQKKFLKRPGKVYFFRWFSCGKPFAFSPKHAMVPEQPSVNAS